MHSINLHLPQQIMFGNGCLDDFIHEFSAMSFRKVMVIADPLVEEVAQKVVSRLQSKGISYHVNMNISAEPTVSMFNGVLKEANQNSIDAVIGIGGGSVLDVAKLVAALCGTGAKIEDVFGHGKIADRKHFLACLPTTAGTGSEVSPNSILLDDTDNQKKAAISPYLVPDIACVDPILTHSIPPSVTAYTGIDAMTHCIEAYANRHAHPMIDLYALEGIRLLFENLPIAFENGSDSDAREKISLGSLYGGICLGPVNTAAVHAIAYPLGSGYGLPHGLSNALLLPHVLEYNLPEGVDRYATIANKIGVKEEKTDMEKAREGIAKIRALCQRLGIPDKLNDFNISVSDVPAMTKSAFLVQRLLKNNPRVLSEKDIENIYLKLY